MDNKSRIEREALDTYHRLVANRDRVDDGELGWDSMADFFTEDAVYIDPAWGRQEGRETIRRFFVDSMAWQPPPEFNMPPGKPDWSTDLPEAWRHLPDVFNSD